MIRDNLIKSCYGFHSKDIFYTDTIFIADYTDLAKSNPNFIGYNVNIKTESHKPDNSEFILFNEINTEVEVCVFDDNRSFLDSNGKPRQHCECVIFPKKSVENSWIIFLELKYSSKKSKYISENIKKGIRQVYKTRLYYYKQGIFTKNQRS